MLDALPRSIFRNEGHIPPATWDISRSLPRNQFSSKTLPCPKPHPFRGNQVRQLVNPEIVKPWTPCLNSGQLQSSAFIGTAPQLSSASPSSQACLLLLLPQVLVSNKLPAHNFLSQCLLPGEPDLRQYCHNNLPTKPLQLSGLQQAFILPATGLWGPQRWLCSRCWSSGLGFRV